ncbi:hypothetical protein A2U01_0053068, partial [Trifolium medium]|nr:hypothetical protein [Trifolium medium]
IATVAEAVDGVAVAVKVAKQLCAV